MPDLTINGFRVHYLRAGKGDPVVLVHGFTSSHAMWWQQVPVLARGGFRVIAPDLRGHGDSEHPGHGYDLDTLADDLANLLDALAIGPAHLCGLSLGGMVAQRFCLAHPGRVRTLTIADSFSSAPPAKVMDVFEFHERVGRERGMKPLFDHLLVHPALPYGPDYKLPFELFPVLERAFMKNRMETMSAYVRTMGTLPDWTADLVGIQCPTLLIVGDYDTPCLDPMARMAEIIPDARLVTIPRCGHSSAVEKGIEFSQIMLEFLGGFED